MTLGIFGRWCGKSRKGGKEFYKELVNRGVSKAEEKKFEEAIAGITKAIQLIPWLRSSRWVRITFIFPV